MVKKPQDSTDSPPRRSGVAISGGGACKGIKTARLLTIEEGMKAMNEAATFIYPSHQPMDEGRCYRVQAAHPPGGP
jgi:hypothetical protein